MDPILYVYRQLSCIHVCSLFVLQDSDTALDIAAKLGHMEVATYLIKTGANINKFDEVSITYV